MLGRVGRLGREATAGGSRHPRSNSGGGGARKCRAAAIPQETARLSSNYDSQPWLLPDQGTPSV